MRITKIRSKFPLETIQSKLEKAFHDAGYITKVSIVNSTQIKVGMHMRCFSIDTRIHGYNAIVYKNNFMNLKKGYKRTNVPVWEQRVNFNNILNNVLNKLKVSGNVKSGPFTIRQGTECFTEQHWVQQTPFGMSTDISINGFHEPLSVRVTEKEAIKSQNILDHV